MTDFFERFDTASCNVMQILNVVRGEWKEAGCWSEWDESVCQELMALQKESLKKPRLRDLTNMIRMKLERRFQVSDYLVDDVTGKHDLTQSPRILASEICQDVMAHVREIHALAERALNSIEGQ